MAPIYLGKMVVPSSLRYIENLARNGRIYFKERTNELSNGFLLFLQLLLSLIIIGELPDISEKDN